MHNTGQNRIDTRRVRDVKEEINIGVILGDLPFC